MKRFLMTLAIGLVTIAGLLILAYVTYHHSPRGMYW